MNSVLAAVAVALVVAMAALGILGGEEEEADQAERPAAASVEQAERPPARSVERVTERVAEVARGVERVRERW